MGDYIFNGKAVATADPRMNNGTVRRLWKGFCLTLGELDVKEGKPFTFRLGNTELPELSDGKEYALRVNENGAAIVGNSYGGLMRGYASLLMKTEQTENGFAIKQTEEESRYRIKNRMLHICVFPENDLYFIKKLIRLAAICQYTHIVIEFWGMLRYDCLKELSWPQAFSKQQVGELISECRELGIEPVPMFNQLGHATASRLCFGKHVVLDRAPQLQNLFTPDGWAWNIESEEVFKLLKEVRKELYEVFGEGEYMHIGCDEAYYISRNAELRKRLPDFLSRLTKEVETEGRRPLMWMDMLLEEGKFEQCCSSGKKDEVEALRNATAPSTVFVDWQYDCTKIPIPSLVSLKDSGHDVMGAPWYCIENFKAHVETVAQNELFGIMLTTWDTLKMQTPTITGCAQRFGASFFTWEACSAMHEITSSLLRRLSFEGNGYEDCGWAKKQVEV